QMVATMGQITERMTESLNSLQKIQESLHSLSGPDVATVLAKLKELCRQLHTEDEQVHRLLEDVQVLASIASSGSLQSLSVSGIQLEEKVRNTHQLFSEVEEQTERNIRHLDKLQTEKEQLEKWFHEAAENALKVKDCTLLQEEALHQRGRTELVSELVSSLRSSNLQQSVLLEQSCELVEQYQNFYTNIGGGSEEVTPSLRKDFEGFQSLVKSIQSWIEDLRQNVDLSLGESSEIRTSTERQLHRAQAVLNATTEAEDRLEELRVTGDTLSQRLLHREDLKQEVQEACYRVEELQHQAEQLPSLFPWPGTAERAQACLLARQLQTESDTLKVTLINLDERRTDLAEKTRNAIWKDASWDELDTHWSALMAEVKLLQDCHHHLTTLHERMTACQTQKDNSASLNPDAAALEALLKQVAEVEKDLLALETLRDSLTGDSTAEAQARLSDQVSDLQNHKRAIECGIKEQLASLLQNEGLQQVRKEASLLLTDLSELAKDVEELFVLADICQLTQQWCAVQECDKQMTELDIRVNDLQRMRETQETLPADATFAVSAVVKNFLRSVFNQKKQGCVEVTAETVGGLIGDLQQWIQTVQVQTSSSSQAALDKGYQLQQALCDVLAQQSILINCLGEEVMTTLVKSASEVLRESQQASDSISKHLVCHNQMQTDMPNRAGTANSNSDVRARDAWDPISSTATDKKDSDSHQEGNKSENLETLSISTKPQTCLLQASKDETDATKPNQEDISFRCTTGRIMEVNKEDAFCAESLDALGSKVPQSASGEIDRQTSIESKDENGTQSSLPEIVSGNTTKTFISNSLNTEALHRDGSSALVLDLSDSDNPKEVSKLPSVTSLKESTEATIPAINVPNLLVTQSERFDALNENLSERTTQVFTVEPVVEREKTQQLENTGAYSPDVLRCNQEEELTEFLEKATRFSTVSARPESDKTPMESCITAAQPETFKAGTDATEQDEHSRQVRGSPDKVFTIVLELQSWDIQQSGYIGASTPDGFRWSKEAQHDNTKLEETSNTGFPEMKSRFSLTLGSPDLREKESDSESTPLVFEHAEEKGLSGQSESKDNQTTHIINNGEALTLSKSCCTDTKCQVSVEHSAEMTFPVSKTEATICQSGGKTECPVLFPVEDSVPNPDETETVKLIVATDEKQLTTAHTMNIGAAGEGAAQGGANDSGCTDGKHYTITAGQENASLLNEEKKWRRNRVLKETVLPLEKPQNQDIMEPERTTPGLPCDPGAEDLTDGPPGTYNYRSSLQESLCEIQGLVEQSSLIKRMPHMDLKCYLKSFPGDADIRLARTVQHILACRYQPARLNAAAMAKQLEEAQEYRRSVQEQVAAIQSNTTKNSDPNTLERAEGEWSSALLDSSATVQVKAAQLDQVKQYQMQKKITRVFLEVIRAEKEKMSLSALGSTSIQTEKLHTVLQTMEQKKSMIDDLHRLSSQLSVHLSDGESSGVLLAQLGDIQEEWRLLKGSIKRAYQQASNSANQSKLVLKEAGELKAKLQALLKFETANISSLDLVSLTADLKVYNQLYLHLQSQANALTRFSLGQKEKDAIEENLYALKALLGVTKENFGSLVESCGSGSTSEINKQLQDLIVLTKQAENQFFWGKRFSVFPEQSCLQMAEMRKFHMETLSRRSKLQMQVAELKNKVTKMEKEDHEVLKTIHLYETVADTLDYILETMKKGLDERKKVLCEFASLEGWVAEMHVKRDSCIHLENAAKADLSKLEHLLKHHQSATVEFENQLKLVDALSESCTKLAAELSPGEGRYLVNRLSGLWADIDGLLAHKKATCWELEEIIHERTSSNEELSTIQANLEQTCADLEKQKFHMTKETLSIITHLEHILIKHQWEVQELQHCQEDQRNSVLCSIGELQDKCKVLRKNAVEQDRYLHLIGQMEGSMDIVKRQIQEAKKQSVSMAERFKLCQTLLVELALVNTQCQEAADQLEAIADELHPSELNSEREMLHHMVTTFSTLEHSVTDDIKDLEAKMLPGLQFRFELPALMELLQRAKGKLGEAKQVKPDEKAIDNAMLQCWVIRRNVEAGMRVLEGLAQKESVNLEDHTELYSLRDAVMEECHSWTVSLSQARESLKDYQWAVQGAIGFLHNAEATFLSAPRGFLDCTQEQRQTQQALEVLEDGFQAHICHLMERVPQQRCLSWPETELLHISILGQLLVGRAVLEAQAKLRLECLQRCGLRQKIHKKWYEDIKQEVLQSEAKLSECASEQVASYDECVSQQKRAKVLTKNLQNLAGKMVDLRAGCPMQGCGVGKDGEVGALWRHWTSLRQGVGLLLTHTEQKGEEWTDITTSIEESYSYLASLQAELPDSSTVSFSQKEPQEILTQVEQHQAALEQEQQALFSLGLRLEHALGFSFSQGSISPEPTRKALEKIEESIRSLKERNLLLMAAAEEEKKEREQVQKRIQDVKNNLFAILPALEMSSNPGKKQELQDNFFSLKSQLKHIMDSLESRYAEIPSDISSKMQNVEQSVQKAEEMLLEWDNPVRKLSRRARELGSGLERVKALIEQRSPTITESQHVLKCVWDELDEWHSSLMLLESEVQDLAEDQPKEAQLLMDQLTEPLQLYQNASWMAENRTTFLSKIPACLQEFEDISHRASCWLDEAQSWLSAPCTFTTAKSLHNHVKYLQVVLDDSERIRHTLKVYKSVLEEISVVCDVSTQEERLDQRDQQVKEMQQIITEPLDQLQEAFGIVDVVETDIKAMEKNVSQIRTILDSQENADITQAEKLYHCEEILIQIRSMQKRLEDLETWKGEIHLPEGTENLVVLSKASLLVEQLDELEQITREQMSLLENKREEEKPENLDIISVSDSPEEMKSLENPGHRRFSQEPFEASCSEEEEDEGDESCHSSSSDTLTCSIPEDLVETINLLDEQREDMSELKPQKIVKEVESKGHQGENCSEEPGNSISCVKPELDDSFGSQNTGPGSPKLGFKADVCQTFSFETVMDDDINDEHVTAAAAAQQEPSKQEIFDIKPQISSTLVEAVVGDTRLIPSRPITPFCTKKASNELIEEEDKHLSLSSVNLSHQDAFNRLKEQKEVSPSPFSGLTGSQKPEEIPKAAIGSPGHEDDDVENQRWGLLCIYISKKLHSLRKILEEQQNVISTQDGRKRKKVPEESSVPTGFASSVLQQIHDTIAMLRQMLYEVKSSGSSHPGVKKKLYEAVQRVLLCVDSSADLLTHDETIEEDPQLRLLQQECLSAQLVTLAELVAKVEAQIKPDLLMEESDPQSCLTSLQDYLHTVQLLFTSSHDQLIEHSGLQHQTLPSNIPCLLDAFDTGQCEIFPNLKGALTLECALGRYLRPSSGKKDELQHASQSLLQGIALLLKEGEESLTENWTSHIPNRGTLQNILCRRKKLLQVLRSQLSFLQYVFQHEPNALKSQEDEWVHLEVRAKALQQRILEEVVASQKKLQDWIHWDHLCGQLGKVLDESEAFISSGEPEGDDDKETVERRLHACKQALLQLDESRTVLGTLLDHRAAVQAEPWFGASVRQTGGALELRWKGAYRRTEQEVLRLRNIQESRARFQTDFTLVSERLLGASKHLKTFPNLAESSDLIQESVQRSLVELLDLSLELEATFAHRQSVSNEAARLLHLMEVDCPGLRGQVSQLEASCSRLTSDLSSMLEHQMQRLLAAQPPVKLLSELENWLKQMETQLTQDKERVLKAKNAAAMAEILQHCRVLRTAVDNCQQVLDLMSQPGPKMVEAEVQAYRLECTTFAEILGSIRLQWLLLQRELDSQIHEVEHIYQTCAERERHLQRLHNWTEQQTKRLIQWRQPTSQTLARSALLELEGDVRRIQEVSAALQELKKVRVHYEKEEKLLCDVIFSDEAESVRNACGDLYQQMEDLRPALQQNVEKWTCFQRALRDFTLYTTRVRCALQHQQEPLFSPQQAEVYSDFLQDLQAKVEAEEEQFSKAVDKSYKRLVETLHDGSAQPLSDQIEAQRTGWKDTLREIREEHKKIREIFSLWHEYANLSDGFSHRLQHLWNEWEELSSSSCGNDTEASICSLKRLQDDAEELQNNAGDVLAASKGLLGRLEPLSANLIKSEARLLTRDILLLNQAISGTKKNLEEDLKQESCDTCDADTLKQVLLEHSDMIPSLVNIKAINNEEMETVQLFNRQLVETITQATDENKVLHSKLQSSLDFQEKYEKLKSIQENLEQESLCRKALNYSNLQEMLSDHQKLQAEVINGHQLLQGLLCDAIKFMEKETGEKRSELMVQVTYLKKSWSNSVALATYNWTLTKEHLQHWRIYRCGLKSLKKLFREVDPFLPPTGPCLYTVQQLQNCTHVNQLIEDAISLHSSLYTQTVEAGKHLCKKVIESESQHQLQSELQDLQKVWERTTLLQRRNNDLVKTSVQMWSQSQEATLNILSGLDKVSHLLAQRPVEPEEEAHIQETELSLQCLSGGLRELATMRTDLSQYVAASDSALLDQQLELLHVQWEELCMKVSLRRQEIADRLNAWTIFNDKKKEFCDWLTQMENKVCHSTDLSIEEMVEKLKKDCMEEINLFSENKSHLKQLGEQLLLASDEAKQTQVCGSLQEVNQRWHNLFQHIEARNTWPLMYKLQRLSPCVVKLLLPPSNRWAVLWKSRRYRHNPSNPTHPSFHLHQKEGLAWAQTVPYVHRSSLTGPTFSSHLWEDP
ncbi:hypothetical protein XENORESO_014913, partial [Xenotaenia resolanae]